MTSRAGIVLAAWRDWRTRPFDWAGACCLSWVGDVAARLTGTDPVADMRGTYTSETEAIRAGLARGWRSLGACAAALYPEIPPAMAQTGDWAICVDALGNEGLGVVCGARVIVRTEDGMGQVPLATARRAFRVT